MRRTGWAWLSSLGLLAACGGGDTSQAAQPSDTAAAAAQPAPGAAAPAGIPAPATPAPASPAATAAKPGGDLSAYVGKWAFDKVGGVSWNDNPTVLAAIEKTVTDPQARKAILTMEGPSSAIAMRQDRVSLWACQQHNCGDHQWLVEIAPDGASAQVCYFDKAKSATARWFLPDGKVESRAGNCNPE